MTLEDLRERFVIDDEVRSERLEGLIQKALPHCVVHKNGGVEVKGARLSGRQLVKLVLAARLLASKLEGDIACDVTVEQIAEYTGLPKAQAAARAKECLDERFAERSSRGSYKARLLKIDEFLDQLAQVEKSGRTS